MNQESNNTNRDEDNQAPQYQLTKKLLNTIEPQIETMDEWLSSMEEEELAHFHRMCNKCPDERSEDENMDICKYSLALYAREMDMDTFPLTPSFLSDVTGGFCANIILEPMRRCGAIESDSPLVLYKDFNITLTQNCSDILNTLNKNN